MGKEIENLGWFVFASVPFQTITAITGDSQAIVALNQSRGMAERPGESVIALIQPFVTHPSATGCFVSENHIFIVSLFQRN